LARQIEDHAYKLADARTYWGKRRWLWGDSRVTRRTVGDWREIRRRNRHYHWLQCQAGIAGFELARRQEIRLRRSTQVSSAT
jgi:hypothetical protein